MRVDMFGILEWVSYDQVSVWTLVGMVTKILDMERTSKQAKI